MKTRMLLITLAILWSSVQIINAQQEKTVYHFCVSYGKPTENSGYKAYFSDVLSATMNKADYYNPNSLNLKLQWYKKLDFLDIKTAYLSYLHESSDWDTDYEKVSQIRVS